MTLFFVIIAALLIFFFYNHTPQSWHCLLLYALKHYAISLKIYHHPLLFLTHQGDTYKTLPCHDWSYNERLADQLKNFQK